jgi:dipeptidyl aminopeptidase/acylaminoacyl peptidase
LPLNCGRSPSDQYDLPLISIHRFGGQLFVGLRRSNAADLPLISIHRSGGQLFVGLSSPTYPPTFYYVRQGFCQLVLVPS